MAERSNRRSPAWTKALRDAGEFVRDVFWLVGWGIRRIGLAAETDPSGASVRGCVGCLASVAGVLFAGLLWRRRRT